MGDFKFFFCSLLCFLSFLSWIVIIFIIRGKINVIKYLKFYIKFKNSIFYVRGVIVF